LDLDDCLIYLLYLRGPRHEMH